MNILVSAGLLIVVVGVGIWWLIRKGRALERGKQAKKNAKIKDEQLEIATDRPAGRDDMADRLRKNGL